MHLWRRCLWRINPTLILWRILDSGFLPKETASQPVRLFLSHYIKPGKDWHAVHPNLFKLDQLRFLPELCANEKLSAREN